MTSVQLGLTAFKKGMLTSSVASPVDFCDFDARRVRYEFLWGCGENNQYSTIRKFAHAYKSQYALYKYVRAIYSPVYRLGEFYKAHIFGGKLDLSAAEAGAIPILTDIESLRPAVAELWKWSQWGVNKDVLSWMGAVYGDVMLQVVDDVAKGRVYLDIMYPGKFADIDVDQYGAIKGYTIQEMRPDPRGRRQGDVTYTEIVGREGQNVVYSTFLNDKPYAWPENVDRTGQAQSEWVEPYGFVPMVHIQHNNVGLPWGWSEIQPAISKMHEADDLASLISDQVRKSVARTPWLLTGMRAPKSAVLEGSDATTAKPEPGREEDHWLFAPAGAEAKLMVSTLNLEHSLQHLVGVTQEIERDYPELSNITQIAGDASGRALRVARQPIVAKVIQRRASYDGGLADAMRMALSIGGMRGYEGYQGIGLESYGQGALDLSIGERAVFESDPLDQADVSIARWAAASQAVQAGVSLEGYLRSEGWTEQQIADLHIQEMNNDKADRSDN